jgi:hypothetical protein
MSVFIAAGNYSTKEHLDSDVAKASDCQDEEKICTNGCA